MLPSHVHLPCVLSAQITHLSPQYVVETRFVGERELGTSHTEIVDVKERIVEVAQPGPACPANTGEAGILYWRGVYSRTNTVWQKGQVCSSTSAPVGS